MFKNNPKYKLGFLIFTIFVFTVSSVNDFYAFSFYKEGMRLISGIIFGILAVVYATDLYEFKKQK